MTKLIQELIGMKTTPNLANEFYPVPKPAKRQKKGKIEKWSDGRAKLKSQFRDYGITECEARLSKCTPKNFLGFAHIKRRNNLTDEEIVDARFCILACQPCHEMLDFKLSKETSEKIMETIIRARGW